MSGKGKLALSMKKRGQFREFRRRFAKNRGALFGLAFLAILVVCAAIPSVIAPYGFDDQQLSLAAAAKISLKALGYAGTGWTKAWKISFWA